MVQRFEELVDELNIGLAVGTGFAAAEDRGDCGGC